MDLVILTANKCAHYCAFLSTDLCFQRTSGAFHRRSSSVSAWQEDATLKKAIDCEAFRERGVIKDRRGLSHEG